MSEFRSALYAGKVMHQRLRPRRHRLSYRIFELLLDLDEIDALASRLRLLSHNRFNLFSFVDADHGEGRGGSLRDYVERQMDEAGMKADGGPIRLLCMPRMLGYAFNPLSVYFCYRQCGALVAILYEVNNTFSQRHSYLIPVEAGGREDIVEQHCAKRLYVSPFMSMDMHYRFRVAPPDGKVAIEIAGSDAEGPIIFTAFAGRRRSLSDRTLAWAFLSYPLLTLRVVAGIHWEALLLWLKGVRLHERPAPPAERVTHAPANQKAQKKVEPDVIRY